MTHRMKAFAAISLAALALTPNLAAAQVNGIATSNTIQAIVQAKAFSAAYKEIDVAYASYFEQMKTKAQDLNNLNAKLDANGDKVVDQAELDAAVKAKNPVIQQIDQKELEIQQLQAPIALAKIHAIEGIARQFDAAQTNVIKAKKISILLAPDAFLYAPNEIDITPAIVAELDRIVPTVVSTPPAGYQATRQGAALFQQIENLLDQARRVQNAQAAAAQQQPAAQPTEQPTGR